MPHSPICGEWGTENVMNAARTIARPSDEPLWIRNFYRSEMQHAWVRLEIK